MIELVDIGASHNFISKQLVAKRRLKTHDFEGFKVRLENGTVDCCKKMVTQVEITTKGYVIKRNFYVANI